MDKNLEQQLQRAIDRSRQWASDGWPVTFGDREVVVSSLPQAQNLPASTIHRLVAFGYWQNVAQIGIEAATWGEKALKYLADNDLQATEAAVYYACYLERPLAEHTRTWEPVLKSLKMALCPSGNKCIKGGSDVCQRFHESAPLFSSPQYRGWLSGKGVLG